MLQYLRALQQTAATHLHVICFHHAPALGQKMVWQVCQWGQAQRVCIVCEMQRHQGRAGIVCSQLTGLARVMATGDVGNALHGRAAAKRQRPSKSQSMSPFNLDVYLSSQLPCGGLDAYMVCKKGHARSIALVSSQQAVAVVPYLAAHLPHLMDTGLLPSMPSLLKSLRGRPWYSMAVLHTTRLPACIMR